MDAFGDRTVDRRRLPELPQNGERWPTMMARQGFLFAGVGSDFCVFVDMAIRIVSESDKARAAQLAILESLLGSATGRVMVDDIVRDLSQPFPDGGRWLGPAVKQLAQDGLIQAVDVTNSRRKSRNGGLSHVWCLADVKAATAKAKRLRAALEFIQDDSAAATAESSNTYTTDRD